jgi:hypothetical protein
MKILITNKSVWGYLNVVPAFLVMVISYGISLIPISLVGLNHIDSYGAQAPFRLMEFLMVFILVILPVMLLCFLLRLFKYQLSASSSQIFQWALSLIICVFLFKILNAKLLPSQMWDSFVLLVIQASTYFLLIPYKLTKRKA